MVKYKYAIFDDETGGITSEMPLEKAIELARIAKGVSSSTKLLKIDEDGIIESIPI